MASLDAVGVQNCVQNAVMHNRYQLITSPLFPIEVKSGPAGRLRSIRVPLCYAGALNDQTTGR